MQVIVNEDLSNEINQLKEMTQLLDKAKDSVRAIQFLTIRQVSEATGWSIPTTQKVFNKKDFPACDYGKEKIVEIGALINYFSVRRCEL